MVKENILLFNTWQWEAAVFIVFIFGHRPVPAWVWAPTGVCMFVGLLGSITESQWMIFSNYSSEEGIIKPILEVKKLRPRQQ